MRDRKPLDDRDWDNVVVPTSPACDARWWVGRCFCCRQVFTFDPARVTRTPFTDEPLCLPCVEHANALRTVWAVELLPCDPEAYFVDDETRGDP